MDGRSEFAADYALAPDALARFDAYAAALAEGQARMNLVGPATMPVLWTRHFADCAQLLALGGPGRWLDLGAGAGLPGLVLALLGAEVDLVEATGKKAEFLTRTADALGLGASVRVHRVRIEALAPWPAGNITARALAPLDRLFDYGLAFASGRTRWVLPKGARAAEEVAAARRTHSFTARLEPSRTSADARIVVAERVWRRVDAARDRQSEGRGR